MRDLYHFAHQHRTSLLWLTALLACNPATTQTLENTGQLCTVDGALVIDFEGCLSSSCDTLDAAECILTEDGSGLSVSGTAEITSQGDVCTADCGFVTASCSLPDGTTDDTTLTYNGSTTTVGELEECY